FPPPPAAAAPPPPGFPTPGTHALTFTADDGLMNSSNTVTVPVGEAAGPAPADFWRDTGALYGGGEGGLTWATGVISEREVG
ncbi:hypothetical protein Q6314_27095, partial [Klebsiella pneumoniae]|nr:hypothetical protein [Klebsiella pneumoniae]